MYVDIDDLAGTLEWRDRILALLGHDPAVPFVEAEWDWFYAHNPVGPPLISLYVESDRVLGHYAIIPTLLSSNGKPFVAYRSMSTMVHPDARGRGLFTILAQRVYDMVAKSKAPLVYGFPNKSSAPGFVKYLGWSLPAPDFVVDLTGQQIRDNADLVASWTAPSAITWCYGASDQMVWRTGRPGYDFNVSPGLITKMFEGQPNVLHISTEGLEALHDSTKYRLLAPAHLRTVLGMDAVFDYQLGFRWFGPKRGDTLQRELILSDVF